MQKLRLFLFQSDSFSLTTDLTEIALYNIQYPISKSDVNVSGFVTNVHIHFYTIFYISICY